MPMRKLLPLLQFAVPTTEESARTVALEREEVDECCPLSWRCSPSIWSDCILSCTFSVLYSSSSRLMIRKKDSLVKYPTEPCEYETIRSKIPEIQVEYF